LPREALLGGDVTSAVALLDEAKFIN